MISGALPALSLVAVLCAGIALADEAAPPESAPEELIKLMDLLSRPESMNARFMERKELSVLNEPLIVTGTLHYQRGGRIERHMTSPYDERFIIEGETLRIEKASRSGARTLAVDDHPVLKAFVESLRAMLGGDLEGLRKHHDVTMAGDTGSWIIKLDPRNPGLSDKVDSIRFSGSGGSILAIEINETGGNRSLMIIVPDSGQAE